MNSFKKMTTIGIVLLIFISITGCSKSNIEDINSDNAVSTSEQNTVSLNNAATEEIKPEKTVSLYLEKELNGDQLTLFIFLMNPKKESITSTQTWLAFNSEDLKGEEINIDDSDFSLTAPYENGFDQEKGLVKIGRSVPGAINKEKVKVAEVSFQIKEQKTLMINAFNYKDDPLSETSANMIVKDKPYNIMMEPQVPIIAIQNNFTPKIPQNL